MTEIYIIGIDIPLESKSLTGFYEGLVLLFAGSGR